MSFEDRVSAYPNRYAVTDENGNVHYAVIERADEPIIPGTPLNAETFNSLFWFTESAEHPGCYFHKVDGEEEWVNPPMLVGTAYRTTERFNGKPVYVKLVSLGALTAKANIEHGEIGITPIRCEGIAIDRMGGLTVPYSSTTGTAFQFMNFCAASSTIWVDIKDFNPGESVGYATMWFVRGDM